MLTYAFHLIYSCKSGRDIIKYILIYNNLVMCWNILSMSDIITGNVQGAPAPKHNLVYLENYVVHIDIDR